MCDNHKSHVPNADEDLLQNDLTSRDLESLE